MLQNRCVFYWFHDSWSQYMYYIPLGHISAENLVIWLKSRFWQFVLLNDQFHGFECCKRIPNDETKGVQFDMSPKIILPSWNYWCWKFQWISKWLESILYPDQIMLMSSHYRFHLVESLIKNRELIARDSTTEFLNQRALRRERATKYAPSFNDKAYQMNQRQHTESTAINFRNQRSRQKSRNLNNLA